MSVLLDSPDNSEATSLKNSMGTNYGASIDYSRPHSVNATRTRADQASRPGVHPLGHNGETRRSGRPISFIQPIHNGARWYQPTMRNKIILAGSQMMSFFISSLFLNAVVLWAIAADISARLPRALQAVEPATFPWDDPKRLKKEKCTKDVSYYARNAGEGYDILNEEVETDDGYYLRCAARTQFSDSHLRFALTLHRRIHRVVNPRHRHQPNGKGGSFTFSFFSH